MKKGHGIINEFWQAAREGPRLYFAPLIGAARAIHEELSASGSARFINMNASTEVSCASTRKRKR
ncbi:hypothetical protein [Sulfuricystis multivorans]|uniref:hypothetical protein n=1 Tax=Sulfuricystis multivorans TaxID=2211108 RepID=UPI000F82EC4D|nr:hypothetical protein [Sulfuricystis multivorans]